MKNTQIKIHSRFDRPAPAGLSFIGTTTYTQQNFADECDINKIIRAAVSSGDTTIFTPQERGNFFDTTTIGDYQAAMDLLLTAREDFMSLPSTIRANFGNDMETYVEFITNPANAAEAVALGILSTAEVAAPEPRPGAVPLPAGDLAPKTTESD